MSKLSSTVAGNFFDIVSFGVGSSLTKVYSDQKVHIPTSCCSEVVNVNQVAVCPLGCCSDVTNAHQIDVKRVPMSTRLLFRRYPCPHGDWSKVANGHQVAVQNVPMSTGLLRLS